MPHRSPCIDAINLLDALTGELITGKLEASNRVAMDLVELKRLLTEVQVELKVLNKKKRR